MHSASRLKCIFIGFGDHARKYADVFNHLNIKISSIFVRKPSEYNIYKKKYQIKKIYSNIDKILKLEKYDFIMVMLPWYLIEKKIEKILKLSTSKFIFSEKPISLSKQKLNHISKTSINLKKNLFILYNRRSYKIFKVIKKNINKNKLISFRMSISEREKQIIKIHSTKIIGNIKYHLTSHWIDLVMWLFNIKKLTVKKYQNSYKIFHNKKLMIDLDYLGTHPIETEFHFKKFQFKTKTLEKLYLIKNNKKKMIINENKLNNFKPGLLNTSQKIVNHVLSKKQNDKLPKVQNLKNLYNVLEFIKK